MDRFPRLFDITAVAALVLLGSEVMGIGAYGLLTLPDQFVYQLLNPWRGQLVNRIGFPYATGATLLLALAAWLSRDLLRERAKNRSPLSKWRIPDADEG